MDLENIISSDKFIKWVQEKYLDVEIIEKCKKDYDGSIPFKNLNLRDFLKNDMLEKLIEEVMEIDFEYKISDLFQFAQSQDFEYLEYDLLKEFKIFLKSEEFLGYIEYITDLKLSKNVDCMSSIYSDTDYLLCHDDELDGRKIAFMLYLTSLDEKDGGQLYLYDADDDTNSPVNIIKKIIPNKNQLTLFEVTEKSFHEVEEISSEDKLRVSISGWFYE